MRSLSSDETFESVERRIQENFSNVPIEFSRRNFPEHLELVVYVLDAEHFDAIRRKCYELVDEMHLDDNDPELWVMAREWTGPWPGGQSVEELQAKREDFMRRHNMVLRPLT